MAKTLKQFLEVYKPKSADEQRFVDKHVTVKIKDRNGNEDDVFQATNVKTIDRKKERKGYNPGEDEKVYEAVTAYDKDNKLVGRYKNIETAKKLKPDHKYVKEELKGNQHKIDANKNGKVDAHDFELLRKKKMMKKEEAEQVDEYLVIPRRDNLVSLKKHSFDTGLEDEMKKTRQTKKSVADAKKKYAKEEAEQIDEISTDTLKSYADKARTDSYAQGGNPSIKKRFNRIDGVNKANAKMQGNAKVNATEEAEQIDELSTSTLKSYRTKARAQGNAIVDKMKMGGGDWSKDQKDTKTLRKRAAGAQASGKQLVKRGESLKTEEVEQLDELSPETLGTYTKKAAGQAAGLAAATAAQASSSVGKANPADKLKLRNRLTGVSKAVDKMVAKEEAEQLDELSPKTLGSYAQKAKDQMSRSDTLAGREMGARNTGAKPGAKEKFHSARAEKRHAGLTMAINKLTKEETGLDEASYSAKAAAAGKDIGKPGKQFSAIAKKAAEKYGSAESGKRVAGAVLAKLRKEEIEEFFNQITTESNAALLMSVYEDLNEDNQEKFVAMCESEEGLDRALDFSIAASREMRGE